MKKIQTYTPQPDFQPEKIEKVITPTAQASITHCGSALVVFPN